MEVSYKDNWNETKERLTAFWNGEHNGRPVTLLTAPGKTTLPAPVKPEKLEDVWTDVDWLVASEEYYTAKRHWLGEACPTLAHLFNWCVAFGFPSGYDDRTIWVERSLDSIDQDIDWKGRARDKYWEKTVEYTKKACAQGRGKYLVSSPIMLPPNDLMSMLRGAENFMIDLIDHPEWVKKHLLEMTECHLEMQKELYNLRSEYFEGNIQYYPIWCPDFLGAWQSDMSCMISEDMYKEFVVPELEKVGEVYDKIIYHVDGPEALKHVEAICSIPEVAIVQWTPGAGNPTGAHWLDLFKKIQDLGKAALIYTPPEDLDILIKELDPALTVFVLGASSLKDGQELLEHINAVTKRYH